jgi:hypothetical protein
MLSHGIRQFREEQVFGPLGVMRLQGLKKKKWASRS